MSEDAIRAIDDLGRSWEQYKSTNDERIRAIENGDTGRQRDLEQKLSRINDDVQKFEDVKGEIDKTAEANADLERRLDELEAKGNLPGADGQTDNQRQYMKAMEVWIRSQGLDRSADEEMKELSRKDVTIGTASAGGHAMPEVISRAIEKLEVALSDVLAFVGTVRVGTNDYKELIDLGGTTSAWSGETGTRNAQTEPLLREIAPTMGEQYTLLRASDWSLDDIFFSVQDWLSNGAAESFALGSSAAIWDGNGTNQPTGMTNTAPVTTNDGASPLRAAAAYEYIDGSASPGGVLAADDILEVLYAVRRPYIPGSRFASNRATTASIRQLKDSQNQYLWQPGLQAGEPNMLVGYPHFVWEDMDNEGAGLFPLAFGNWTRGYVRAIRTDIRITVDQVTVPGHVNYYIRRREGGIPRNNDAIKFVQT